jgi:hypothetical protein
MNTFFEIMPYFCVAYGAFSIGKHWALYQFSQNLSNNPDEMIKVLNKIKQLNAEEIAQTELEPAVGNSESGTEMKIERVGDQLYAYAKDTNQFLGQATNLTALLETVKQRFPGKEFFGTISADDPAKELAK